MDDSLRDRLQSALGSAYTLERELGGGGMLTQTTIAELLETSQGEVSKIGKRTDMYVSTLRRYIEAMGGQLDVVARFPDGDVRITQFQTAGE